VQGIDQDVHGDAGVFFGELGNVGITRSGGGAGVAEQMLDMA